MDIQAESNQIQSNPVFSCESSREHSFAAAWVRALIRASVCRTASSSGLRPRKDLARLEEQVNISPFLTCGGRVLTHASSVSNTAAVNLANSDLRDGGDGAEQGKTCTYEWQRPKPPHNQRELRRFGRETGGSGGGGEHTMSSNCIRVEYQKPKCRSATRKGAFCDVHKNENEDTLRSKMRAHRKKISKWIGRCEHTVPIEDGPPGVTTLRKREGLHELWEIQGRETGAVSAVDGGRVLTRLPAVFGAYAAGLGCCKDREDAKRAEGVGLDCVGLETKMTRTFHLPGKANVVVNDAFRIPGKASTSAGMGIAGRVFVEKFVY
ncbi:hypothetical protein B0H14DRAFT_3770193 [Mycena olivaceomarginata]|nr:hypothetical protein B0H14DRAFT_3770193 [Mycena olivaceomarginata]